MIGIPSPSVPQTIPLTTNKIIHVELSKSRNYDGFQLQIGIPEGRNQRIFIQ